MIFSVAPVSRLVRLTLGLSVASLLALGGCKRTEATASQAKGATTAPAVPEPWQLKGRWLRPDGGYILAVGEIADDGRAEASYFNPSPIRVAWARARSESGSLRLEVELRDHNYPGCLYKLTYRPQNDQLVGTYFQAQMHETHEVFFVRAH
jgi:hypothetical protein